MQRVHSKSKWAGIEVGLKPGECSIFERTDFRKKGFKGENIQSMFLAELKYSNGWKVLNNIVENFVWNEELENDHSLKSVCGEEVGSVGLKRVLWGL